MNLKDYLRSFKRNNTKNKIDLFVGVASMVLSFSCMIVLLIYLNNEMNYDAHFSRANRIYRVHQYAVTGYSGENSSSCSYGVGTNLFNDYNNIIENYVRFFNWWGGEYIIKSDENKFIEKNFAFVDSTLLNVFDLQVIKGDAKSCLEGPNKVIISQSIAKKYFGNSEPIGRIIKIDNTYDVQVTAVFEDIPSQSHFKFNIFCSLATLKAKGHLFTAWEGNPYWTYVVLKEGITPDEVNSKFKSFREKYIPWDYEHYWQLFPLQKIHLNSHLNYEIEKNANKTNLLVIAILGLLLILTGFVNYINLLYSNYFSRQKEFNVRRFIGASKQDIIFQLILESFIMIFSLIVISMLMVYLLIPEINKLLSISITQGFYLTSFLQKYFLLFLLILIVLTIIPSLLIVLLSERKREKKLYINGFSINTVTIQYIISFILIASSIFIYKQNKLLINKDYGFDGSNVIILNVEGTSIKNKHKLFFEKLNNGGNFESYCSMQFLFGYDYNSDYFWHDKVSADKKHVIYYCIKVNHGFFDLFNMKMIAGRSFSNQFVSDSKESVIINSAMAKQLNWMPEQAIGQNMYYQNKERIIGVVNDFCFLPLYESVKPIVVLLYPENTGGKYLALKYKNNIEFDQIIDKVKTVWHDLITEKPFEYEILEDKIARIYIQEKVLGRIVIHFMTVSIILACLGMYSVTKKITKQKEKEMCIRKVNGAGIKDVFILLFKKYTLIVSLSVIIASPIAYYAIKYWLRNFAYQTKINLYTFILVGIALFIIVAVTIFNLIRKIALQNPSIILKYE